MSSAELLADGFGRVRDIVHKVVDGLTAEELSYRVDSQANTIGWLVWHLTRIPDDHIADPAGLRQRWQDGGRQECGVPFSADDTGYGHRPDQVAAVRVPAEVLTGYHDATLRADDLVRQRAQGG